MVQSLYRGRKCVQIENNSVRVTVMVEGGHIAEILHKASGVNPLWAPPWPTIEPSIYDPVRHLEYGSGGEAHLLSGILGHNICLDVFGAPTEEEGRAGIPIHGEAGFASYSVSRGADWIEFEANLKQSQIHFQRRISLGPDADTITIVEQVENLAAFDRPISWTQHVTLGPPFLEPGRTEFRLTASRSKVMNASFNDGQGMQQPDAEFEWPLCPRKDRSFQDLRVFPADRVSGGFTAHLMNNESERAGFWAWSPDTTVLFGYTWQREDFPWLARWEENHLRTQPPWNGNGLACGMEFGVSPFVGNRRDMVALGSLFEVPTFRWLPAKTRLQASYSAFIRTAPEIPEKLDLLH